MLEYDKKKLYGLKSIEIPIVFLINSKYRTLSDTAKIAWALFRYRYKLSAASGFEEPVPGENGKSRVYFYFTNENLMTMLNVHSRSAVTQIIKELVDAHLVEVKQIGVNRVNKMYLLKPEITDDDIYQIDELEKVPKVPSP